MPGSPSATVVPMTRLWASHCVWTPSRRDELFERQSTAGGSAVAAEPPPEDRTLEERLPPGNPLIHPSVGVGLRQTGCRVDAAPQHPRDHRTQHHAADHDDRRDGHAPGSMPEHDESTDDHHRCQRHPRTGERHRDGEQSSRCGPPGRGLRRCCRGNASNGPYGRHRHQPAEEDRVGRQSDRPSIQQPEVPSGELAEHLCSPDHGMHGEDRDGELLECGAAGDRHRTTESEQAERSGPEQHRRVLTDVPGERRDEATRQDRRDRRPPDECCGPSSGSITTTGQECRGHEACREDGEHGDRPWRPVPREEERCVRGGEQYRHEHDQHIEVGQAVTLEERRTAALALFGFGRVRSGAIDAVVGRRFDRRMAGHRNRCHLGPLGGMGSGWSGERQRAPRRSGTPFIG